MIRRVAARHVGTSFGVCRTPPVENQPAVPYARGTTESKLLQDACGEALKKPFDIPIVIDGVQYRNGPAQTRELPFEKRTTFATYYNADEALCDKAIDAALKAHRTWSRVPFYDRAAILLKAAHLLTTTHRYRHMAATMLGQSKSPWQAQIDCIDELADFFRFHVKFAEQLYAQQPLSLPNGSVWNSTEYRPLEGFVAAITPFNFSAIGANLAATPVLMGNVVLWKPSPSAVVANYELLQLLTECGLPKGVINFLPCEPEVMARVLRHRELSAVAFTGSTAVFQSIYSQIGANISGYRDFPRLSGETGGKNYHLVHPSADVASVAACTVRSAFEYQGQKCSACSRLFAPKSLWPRLKAAMLEMAGALPVGRPDNLDNFMGAVINEAAFNKICTLIEAGISEGCTVLTGGKGDKSEGWFVPPTILQSPTTHTTVMRTELFGPVLTAYVYDDGAPNAWQTVCEEINASRYGLTGSIFCQDREQMRLAQDWLRYASGMLYLNDKSTGAVVGQQPFGGSRASGTNDKPGGAGFVGRWVTERTIKETLSYERQVSYPHMSRRV